MARPVGKRGETRERVVDAALELFGEHGVGGTSLQMIAERLGVTKAAGYYPFPAQDDIVVAVRPPVFDQLAGVVDEAGRHTAARGRSDHPREGMVDLDHHHRRRTAD